MDVHERLWSEMKEDRLRTQVESDKRMEKMERDATDLDNKSVQNYADWRNYLHKYFTVVLAFIAGSGVLASTQVAQDSYLKYGIFFALAGILIGFLGINIYFYIERKWFQAQHTMSAGGYYDYHEHPEVDDGDILMAIKLHLKEKLLPFEMDLKSAKTESDRIKIASLRKIIKARKREIFLLNFVGQQFSFMQTIWISFVSLSLLLSFVGMTLVFISVIDF